MPRYFKSGNTWYKQEQYQLHRDKSQSILNRYVKTVVNGVEAWRPLYSYRYTYSSWSSCSKECNTGTQTRTAQCVRNDGVNKPDIYCTKSGVTKAALTQNCNTHTCSYTYYLSAASDDYGEMFIKYTPGAAWITAISQRSMWNERIKYLAAYPFTVTSNRNQPIYIKLHLWNGGGSAGSAWRMCKNSHGALWNYNASTTTTGCTAMQSWSGYNGGGWDGTWYFIWYPDTNQIVRKQCCGSYCTMGLLNWGMASNCNGEPF